jgi:hypothetical protein
MNRKLEYWVMIKTVDGFYAFSSKHNTQKAAKKRCEFTARDCPFYYVWVVEAQKVYPKP